MNKKAIDKNMANQSPSIPSKWTGTTRRRLTLSIATFIGGVVCFLYASTGAVQPFYVDEMFYDRYAMELAQWFTSSEVVTFTYVHPSGFSMLLAAVYGMYFLVGKYSGQFTDVTSFLIHFGTHRADFIIIGRLLSAAFASATVPALFFLSRRLFNERTAHLASFAFILCYPVIFYAHISANLTMLMFLTVMAMYSIVRVWKEGRTCDYVFAGVFIGIAVGTKYYPVLLALPLALAHFYRTGWSLHRQRGHIGKLFVAGVMVVVLTLVMFPLPVLEFGQWSYFLKDTYSYYTGGNVFENAYRLIWGVVPHYAATAAEPSPWWSNSLRSLSETTLIWFGLALPYAAYRFPRRFILLASPFLVMLGVQCIKGGLGLGVRQLYFGIPLLFVLSSAAVAHAIDLLRAPARFRTALFLVVTLVLLSQPALWSVRFISLLSRPTTVELGRAWLVENLPKGSVLLCDGSAAPFGETEGWWVDTPRQTFSAKGSELFVHDARRNASRFKVLNMKWKSARLDCDSALAVGSPVYIVTTDYFFSHYWHPETLHQWGNMRFGVADKMRAYVREMTENMKTIHVIDPHRANAIGPTITIARMEP